MVKTEEGKGISGMTLADRLRFACAMMALAATSASQAEVFDLPGDGDTVVGQVTTVVSQEWDTLLDIARRHGLGYYDIVRANPEVDPWLPGDGTRVILPTRFVLPDVPWEGVVLNLPEYRMYYFPPADPDGARTVMTFPISIGRMDWETPLGMTRVTRKAKNPAWYPPESVRQEHEADGRSLPRVVPPGPDNPLGQFAMRLAIPGYLIHGTNKPAGVGMRVTHGCIRMFPEDIEFVFERIPVDTPVRIIDEPYKFGWYDGQLLMEAHPPLETVSSEGEESGGPEPVTVSPLTRLTRLFVSATEGREVEVDWGLVESVHVEADGVPRRIDSAAGEDVLLADKKTPRRARR
ncbi:MAG: L,D-transpeptidase family protein [Gammaproteobacteria bacterium]